MSESFDLRHPELFTTGAVGPKGMRVFYLQAVQSGQVVTLKLEKQQVDALADYLERLLADLPSSPSPVPAPELREPAEAAWVVGGLGVAYDERDDRVVLVAEELRDEDDDDEDDDEPGVARLHLQRHQVSAFIQRARDVVAAGRPRCPFCGAPIDPAQGLCPCYN